MTWTMAFECTRLTQSDLCEEVEVFEIFHTAISDPRIDKIRTAVKQDESMQILTRTIQSGWPNECRCCPKEVQDYWNIRDKLSIIGKTSLRKSSAIVIKGDRIVIPPDQHQEGRSP